MKSKRLLRVQWIKRHRIAVGVGLIILVIGVALVVVGFVEGTGFSSYTIITTSKTISATASPTTVYQPGKTLWDWLQLLIILAVLAVGGFIINLTISRSEQEATKQRAESEKWSVFFTLTSMILRSTIAAASPPPASASDFFSSQLFGIIIGGVISAVVSFAGSWIIYKQQQQRDRDTYGRQVEREDLAYKRQLEREQEAYRRSLKDAKIGRLRSIYRILLNTADKYQVEAQQINHLASPVNISLTGVDEAVNEVTLEGVGADVLSIFFEVRGAFYIYTANLSTPAEGNWGNVIKHKEELIAKVEELKTAMNRNLDELEHLSMWS